MKFLYGYFHPQTGESVVALADKNGVYTGQARLHPDDKDYASEFAGCRLAERRAWIQYLRKECRRKQIMLNTIKDLMKDIDINCDCYIDPKVKRRFNLKLRDYSNEISEFKEAINTLQTETAKDIKFRDELIERTKKAKIED